jgi:hypothetical protein
LFSWTAPAASGRQIGEMLLVKTTSVERVMMAKSLFKVLLSKLGCFTKEIGVKLDKVVNRINRFLLLALCYLTKSSVTSVGMIVTSGYKTVSKHMFLIEFSFNLIMLKNCLFPQQ